MANLFFPWPMLFENNFLSFLIFSFKNISFFCRNFTQATILKENISTSLAFSYLVHDNPGIFEILLHLTFRPHNSYCIYIDLKTDEEIKDAFSKIKDCYLELFPETNIFTISKQKVSWGTYTSLNAELTCLEALIKSKR